MGSWLREAAALLHHVANHDQYDTRYLFVASTVFFSAYRTEKYQIQQGVYLVQDNW